MNVYCPECGAHEKLSPQRWRCDCGGAWDPVERTDFDPALIDGSDFTIWRYRRLFGLDFETPRARLGVGWTPLLPLELYGREVLVHNSVPPGDGGIALGQAVIAAERAVRGNI